MKKTLLCVVVGFVVSIFVVVGFLLCSGGVIHGPELLPTEPQPPPEVPILQEDPVEPAEEEPAFVWYDEAYIPDPELIAERTANFLPDFPWDEIGWTATREQCAKSGLIVYLGDYHPHPSVVGLPEEVPGRGWPTDPEQVRYLGDVPREDGRDIGGGVYLIGFDDTFIYEDDRGLEGLRNPTYAELVAFLAEDKTNEHPYEVRYWVYSKETPGEKVYITEAEVEDLRAKGDGDYYTEPAFVCGDFALMLRENANEAGWRCAFLSVGFLLHYRNAFETVDRGLVWVEPQSDVMINPVTDRYTPYPIPFGDEGTMRPDFKGYEMIIVYVW